MVTFRLRLLALAAFAGIIASARASGYASRADRPWTTDRVLVKWRDGTPPASPRFPVVHSHRQGGMSTMRIPKGTSMDSALAELRADPRVLMAEPNVRRRLLTVAAPNEPGWTAKDPRPDYTTRSLGIDIDPVYQQTYMWPLHKIKALEAWNVYPGTYYTAATKPANTVKIAVLDTGCDITHPDWKNTGGTSVDATAGGQLDMANAVSFLDATGVPQPLTGDPVGHGTFTAGIVAAAANNGGTTSPVSGAIGLAYALQVIPIQVLDDAVSGSVDDVISGIYWAVDHGAQVISISLGDYTYSAFEQEAVDYAWNHNVLVVAAAGNDNLDPSTGGPGQNRVTYPAANNHVLAVAATDIDDYSSSYSNHGSYIGIAAPGGDLNPAGVTIDFLGIPLDVPTQFGVWSTVPTYPYQLQIASDGQGGTINDAMLLDYDYAPGTSAACPFVSALAGIYAQKNGITRDTPNAAALLYQALQRTADNIDATAGGGWNEWVGFGRINALATLTDTAHAATVGCIVGKVTSNGIPVPGATISAVPAGGGAAKNKTARANDAGFRLTNLVAGNWVVTATTATAIGTVVINVQPGVDNFGAVFNFPWPYGDVNHSGKVDMRDAVAAARIVAGVDPADPYGQQRLDIYPWAGVGGPLHGEGDVDMRDVAQILRIAAGLRLL